MEQEQPVSVHMFYQFNNVKGANSQNGGFNFLQVGVFVNVGSQSFN